MYIEKRYVVIILSILGLLVTLVGIEFTKEYIEEQKATKIKTKMFNLLENEQYTEVIELIQNIDTQNQEVLELAGTYSKVLALYTNLKHSEGEEKERLLNELLTTYYYDINEDVLHKMKHELYDMAGVKLYCH